jgi:hypothetical protein
MKQLTVPFLSKHEAKTPMSTLAKSLTKIKVTSIDIASWGEAFPYTPKVDFKMAFTTESIALQYVVQEKAIRAVNNQINGSVWEDSCVEFFVSWDNGVSYYNLEFNCIGTGLIGFGKGRDNRERLPEDLIKTIAFDAHIAQHQNGFQWSLLLHIPLSVFKYHSLIPLHGRTCRANFYKCGDKLPDPHFMSWSPITFHKPNFHLPEFFGELVFAG